MLYASKCGIRPENSGDVNAAAFNLAIKDGGELLVDIPGEYRLSEPVVLPSHTHLFFADGVVIVREPSSSDETGYVFVNDGAYSGKYTEDITIDGLTLRCCGVCSSENRPTNKKVLPGLIGHLSFLTVRNLRITLFTCLDLPPKDFGIQICTFENAVLEDLHIEGKKDGVHFGRGRNFVVRRGRFRTFDDPIALNAHDYTSSNPQLGWIENGLIEDCWDLDDDDTVGFFCRILAGSWGEWHEGMTVQRSDTVATENGLFRVLMPPDGRTYVSTSRPCHASGMKTYPDGITWVASQKDAPNNVGCRNIVFRNIHLQKKRQIAFCFCFDHDAWSRSYYPGTDAPVQDAIRFENVTVESDDVPLFLYSVTPIGSLRFKNCAFGKSRVEFRALVLRDDEKALGTDPVYPPMTLNFSDCSVSDDRETVVVADEFLSIDSVYQTPLSHK